MIGFANCPGIERRRFVYCCESHSDCHVNILRKQVYENDSDAGLPLSKQRVQKLGWKSDYTGTPAIPQFLACLLDNTGREGGKLAGVALRILEAQSTMAVTGDLKCLVTWPRKGDNVKIG